MNTVLGLLKDNNRSHSPLEIDINVSHSNSYSEKTKYYNYNKADFANIINFYNCFIE